VTHVGYSVNTEGAVALVAATAKTVLGVNGTAAFGVNLTGYTISMAGTVATDASVLVELCYATFATNAPGTASTTVTVDQRYGRTITPGFTGAKNWTTEPTVLTPFAEMMLDPYKTTWSHDYPLGSEPDSAVSQGFAIRCNSPATLSIVRATLRFERT
jgi:hypothetical protein